MSRRAFVTAATGALGVSAFAVATIGGAPSLGLFHPSVRPPASQLGVNQTANRSVRADQFSVDHRFSTDPALGVWTLMVPRLAVRSAALFPAPAPPAVSSSTRGGSGTVNLPVVLLRSGAGH